MAKKETQKRNDRGPNIKMKPKGIPSIKVEAPKKPQNLAKSTTGTGSGRITKFHSRIGKKTKPKSLDWHMKRYHKMDIFR